MPCSAPVGTPRILMLIFLLSLNQLDLLSQQSFFFSYFFSPFFLLNNKFFFQYCNPALINKGDSFQISSLYGGFRQSLLPVMSIININQTSEAELINAYITSFSFKTAQHCIKNRLIFYSLCSVVHSSNLIKDAPLLCNCVEEKTRNNHLD